MEQDAIETLLFMSSPGTSGYHSASQNSQRNQDVRNVDGRALQNVQWHEPLHDRQLSNRQPGSSGVFQSGAGDEIDQILDQMNSDSEDDNYIPKQFSRHAAVSGATYQRHGT